MAGINIEKYHGGTEAKAVLRHCDKDRRMSDSHTNRQINKSLTAGNRQYALKGSKSDYVSVSKEYDDRIAKIDEKALKTPRKDRVTLVGMELPRPENLPPERFKAWSEDALRTIMRFYPSGCLLAAYSHVDEVHDYKKMDEDTQKVLTIKSREHVHVFLTPYSEKAGGSLNAKEFTSRKNLIELNRLVNEMSVEKYGVTFCNGSGRKSKKSVEDLKSESRALEQAEIARLQAENERLRAENDRLRAELNKTAVKARERADEGIDYSGYDSTFSL